MPHPIPVVRVIVTDPAGRVLLLRRAATDYGRDGWCLPGGKVDWNQAVADAAARELLEETGLSATSLSFLFYQDSFADQPGGLHCINFYFRATADGELRLNAESSGSAFVALDDLDGYEIVFGNRAALSRLGRPE